MKIPENLHYTNDHEWTLKDGEVYVVGITDYAQEQLGEVVFLQLPAEGEQFEKGDEFGVVESTKAVSDLYMPLSGKVLEVNEPLQDDPAFVNEDPYGEGWLIKIRATKPHEYDELMNAKSYTAYLEEQEH